jgi:hypothetical protein
MISYQPTQTTAMPPPPDNPIATSPGAPMPEYQYQVLPPPEIATSPGAPMPAPTPTKMYPDYQYQVPHNPSPDHQYYLKAADDGGHTFPVDPPDPSQPPIDGVYQPPTDPGGAIPPPPGGDPQTPGGDPQTPGGDPQNPDQGTGFTPREFNLDPFNPTPSAPWLDPNIPTTVGGVSAVDPNAQAFDYNEVGDFSQAAYDNAMRALEPQMQAQDERFAQDLINKGIDPNSEAGQRALANKTRQQSDLQSKAAFDALGFGQGMQQQMFNQAATRSGMANSLLGQQWQLGQRGHEFDQSLASKLQDQAFQQAMGLEGLNYRDYLTYLDEQRYRDSLAMAMAGRGPGPSYTTGSPGLVTGYQQNIQGQQNQWNSNWG